MDASRDVLDGMDWEQSRELGDKSWRLLDKSSRLGGRFLEFGDTFLTWRIYF